MGPIYKFKIGGVEGVIWDGKYGLNPAIKMTKMDKEKNFKSASFVYDNGDKVYLNQKDCMALALVCDQLARQCSSMESKGEEEAEDKPRF